MKADLREKIIEAIDIVDYIGEAVNLRRRGVNFVGLCPFHQEKTPSFTVSPEKKIFKCFGCGKSGNVITFAIEYYGLTYHEALKELAKRAGIRYEPLTEKVKEELTKRDRILQALEYAKKYYQKVLYTQSGNVALAYLANRGYTKTTIAEFEIGYAPSGWDNLLRELTSAGFSKEILLEAGLIKQKEHSQNEFYDLFRERIMFPIHNHSGKVVGFGGRILKEVENQPKYLNSPQTELFDKSKLLFGLFKGRNEIRANESVILVEGYADVIALHQAGFKNAIASCGTSLTEEQLNQIARYCKTIYIAYDGDEAGQKATERAIQLALPLGFEVLIVKLIENEDPDSIVKKYGAKAFHNLLDNSKSFLQYLYELAQSKSILTRPAQKSKFIHYCLHLISTIPDKLQHIEFVQELADLLSLPYSQLNTLLKEKSKLEKEKVESAENIVKPDFSINITKQELELEEEQLISICLEFPEAFDLLKIKKFHSEQMITENGKLLFSILENHYGKDILNNILIDPEVPQEKKDYFVNLVLSKEKLSERWEKFGFDREEKDTGKILEDVYTKFNVKKIDLTVKELRKKMVEDPANQEQYLKKMQEELRRKQKLLNFLRR
ncbi:DNA primase [Bacteroidetes/Chlorobi group bacterium Naka2016]|nr:MAG: DNA primase [Bacteroidetes/Chlorobi group bacterium Naka2016]